WWIHEGVKQYKGQKELFIDQQSSKDIFTKAKERPSITINQEQFEVDDTITIIDENQQVVEKRLETISQLGLLLGDKNTYSGYISELVSVIDEESQSDNNSNKVIFYSFNVGKWKNKLNAETSILFKIFSSSIHLSYLPINEKKSIAEYLSELPIFQNATELYSQYISNEISIDKVTYYIDILRNSGEDFLNESQKDISKRLFSHYLNSTPNELSYVIDESNESGKTIQNRNRKKMNNSRSSSSKNFHPIIQSFLYDGVSVRHQLNPAGFRTYLFKNRTSLTYGIIDKNNYDQQTNLFLGSSLIESNLWIGESIAENICNGILGAATPNNVPIFSLDEYSDIPIDLVIAKFTPMNEANLSTNLVDGKNFNSVIFTDFFSLSAPSIVNWLNIVEGVISINNGVKISPYISKFMNKYKDNDKLKKLFQALSKANTVINFAANYSQDFKKYFAGSLTLLDIYNKAINIEGLFKVGYSIAVQDVLRGDQEAGNFITLYHEFSEIAQNFNIPFNESEFRTALRIKDFKMFIKSLGSDSDDVLKKIFNIEINTKEKWIAAFKDNPTYSEILRVMIGFSENARRFFNDLKSVPDNKMETTWELATTTVFKKKNLG
ncbi:hypothetical protein MHK_004965, partial [Candidatus Magnetomorum sp. HK-1]